MNVIITVLSAENVFMKASILSDKQRMQVDAEYKITQPLQVKY